MWVRSKSIPPVLYYVFTSFLGLGGKFLSLPSVRDEALELKGKTANSFCDRSIVTIFINCLQIIMSGPVCCLSSAYTLRPSPCFPYSASSPPPPFSLLRSFSFSFFSAPLGHFSYHVFFFFFFFFFNYALTIFAIAHVSFFFSTH